MEADLVHVVEDIVGGVPVAVVHPAVSGVVRAQSGGRLRQRGHVCLVVPPDQAGRRWRGLIIEVWRLQRARNMAAHSPLQSCDVA